MKLFYDIENLPNFEFICCCNVAVKAQVSRLIADQTLIKDKFN